MSDSVRLQRPQPTRLLCPWDSPGKNTGVGCHFLLRCMKVKSESEVVQSCLTLSDPWTAAYQTPPSMGFSRQEYWSGLPLPSPKKSLLTIYPSAGAAAQKYHDQEPHTTDNYFLTALEAASPKSRCGQGWFLLKPLSLACLWPPSHYVFQ